MFNKSIINSLTHTYTYSIVATDFHATFVGITFTRPSCIAIHRRCVSVISANNAIIEYEECDEANYIEL